VPGEGDERQRAIEGAEDGEQPEERRLGLARGDEAGHDLSRQRRQDERKSEGGEERAVVRQISRVGPSRYELEDDRGGEDGDRDDEDEDDGRQRVPEAGAVFEDFIEEDAGRRGRSRRPALGVADEPPQADVAQLAERRVDQREEDQREEQRARYRNLDCHKRAVGCQLVAIVHRRAVGRRSRDGALRTRGTRRTSSTVATNRRRLRDTS
jgi:hypothetical protein